MDLYAMTDFAIAEEIGGRLRALRLRKNRSQSDIADATEISRVTIDRLERGEGKISTLVAVLRELGQLEGLEAFLPESFMIPSPLDLARRKGRMRKRATGKRTKRVPDMEVDW
jgi:transcriptional regulator with XRE-family HTH domain